MTTFDIKEEFMIDGQPVKILSGAIHYFRIHPDDWYHSLYNLKALGFNTVETYVPWNFHEAYEGTFNFDGLLDIENFLDIAQSLDLYVIVRPSPYICAEWDFGGLPAWLLTKNLRIRSNDPKFLSYVNKYYDVLLPKLIDHQIDHGGNILMMQVENEYGSYCQDKQYLKNIKNMMIEKGVTVPLFTSDGSWLAPLESGSMIEDDILVTGNFGSNAEGNFKQLTSFMKNYNKDWPLMCMEFWGGWFNRWGQPIVKRDTDELVDAVREAIKLGSVNIYMFHGGTNFGFMSGCSARKEKEMPQITSYDYGALLDEQGNPTERYYGIQKMLASDIENISQNSPLIKQTMSLSNIPLHESVSLCYVLEDLALPVTAKYPQSMENCGQNSGYILYRTTIPKYTDEEKIKVINADDRLQIFLDNQHIATQYQDEIGEEVNIKQTYDNSQLDILVEHMGRVNYGFKLDSPTQKKGIKTGVMQDIHFILDWKQYPIDIDKASNIDFNNSRINNTPAFYKFVVDIDKPEDTFIDLSEFGKGCVLVNGFNIGRFWQIGPTLSLYISKHLLKKGTNEIIIFETEGVYDTQLNLVDHPIYKDITE